MGNKFNPPEPTPMAVYTHRLHVAVRDMKKAIGFLPSGKVRDAIMEIEKVIREMEDEAN